MKRNLALVAAGTLIAGLLTGCGGSGGASTEAYCDSMKSAKKSFEDFDSGDFAGLEAAVATFHELAAAAPDEIADAWETLDGTMVTLEEGLAEAGLKLSDLEAVSNGEIPEGVNMEKLATLGEDLQKMSAEEVQDASDAIEKHAKDECDVEL